MAVIFNSDVTVHQEFILDGLWPNIST